MIIKICGISTVSAAQAVKEAGADLMGFVFAESRRKIPVEEAKKISAAVQGIGKVGVFVNASLAEVHEIARNCRLDYIQLHGDETPEYCRQVKYPVIKAVRVGENLDINAVKKYQVAWLLLDSFAPGRYGGTGITFSWKHARNMIAELATPVIVAGGLTPDNVGQAIATLAPRGVDVSGGVETGGVKDNEKIYQFVAAARRSGGMVSC